MFFSEPNRLPNELILNILNRLPLSDAIAFLTVSKEMQAFIKDDSVWRKFGADNFTAFATRISKLPVFFRKAIINGKYDFAFSEKICDVVYGRNEYFRVMDALKLLLPKDEYPNTDGFWNVYTLFKVVMPQYSSVIPELLTYWSINSSTEQSVAIGFLEELISPEQMAKLDSWSIRELFNQDGIKALKNKLITPEYAAIKPSNELAVILMKLVENFNANQDINDRPHKKPRK